LLPLLNRYKPFGTTADVDFKTKRPCHGTQRSHINQVVLDTRTWEASVTFRLESSEVVECYARNDHLGLMIPYEFQGVDHHYEPDFIVRLTNRATVVLEVKGFEDAETTAKHNAAQRWVTAVNNAQNYGQWVFHVCRDPQMVEKELNWLLTQTAAPEPECAKSI
jgi:type III restriction enzyme